MIASGGEDATVKVWDLAAWQAGDMLPPVRTFQGHTESVNCVAFSPNGRLLASSGRDQTISIWNVATGKEERTFAGTAWAMNRMAFSPDGRTLAAGCDDGGVRLWNVIGQSTEGALLCKLAGRVRCVAFSPDGTLLACGGDGRQVWVTELATSRRQQRLVLPNTISNVTFSADGKILAAVCDFPDGALRVWDVTEWKETARRPLGTGREPRRTGPVPPGCYRGWCGRGPGRGGGGRPPGGGGWPRRAGPDSTRPRRG